MQKPITHPLAGLLISSAQIVYSLILTFSGFNTNTTLGMLSYVILMGGLIGFIYLHGRSEDNTASFSQLFTYGFKATAVATLVLIAFQVVFFTVFPEYKEQLFDIAREQMLKQGNLPEDQIQPALEILRKFFWPTVIGGVLLNNLFAGAFAGLIGAWITPKKEKNPFDSRS
jgi:hypothetical protein